jgi:hypothetical protein
MKDHLNIVLVHGTFARHAKWCKENSSLYRMLVEKFPGANIKVFNWSGFNLHRARFKAAKNLSNFVARNFPEGEADPLIVIAHSHGGAVVQYSMRSEVMASRTSGVVTLATPFFVVEPRSFSPLLYWIVRLFALQAISLIILTIVGAVTLIGIQSGEIFNRIAHRLGFINIVLLPMAYFLYKALRAMYLGFIADKAADIAKNLYKTQGQLFVELCPPSIDGIPLLAFAPVDDEARRALIGTFNLSRTLSNPFVFICGVSLIVPYLAVWVMMRSWTGYSADDVWTVYFMLGLPVAFLALPITAGIALLPTLMIPRALHAPVFGEEGIVENFLLSITASATAPAWKPVSPKVVEVQHTFFSLRHSLIYEDEGTLETTTNWIQDIVDQGRTDVRQITTPAYSPGPIASASQLVDFVIPVDRR